MPSERTAYHRRYYHKRVKREKESKLLEENPYYKQYKKAKKFIVVNDNDPDLQPIKIYLPDPPPEREIDGWGLPASEQFFKRPEIPSKLLQLQKRCKTIEECIDALRKNKQYYKDEIAFIQEEWRRRRQGYWFYNNGEPTYIAGVHYFYLVYWWLGAIHPQYRSRDRKFFLFAMMCLLDPYCAGFNYPKFRREGATSKAACFMYWLITQERNGHAGIQSKDEQSASEIFVNHIMSSHKKMAFWFKPITRGKTEAQSSLDFYPVGSNISKSGIDIGNQDSLESVIDHGSSTEGYYDGYKLRMHYGDESGKTIKADVYKRHLIVKPSIMEGNTYIGFMLNTSTVGEMMKGGGDSFKLLCSQSMYHDRNSNNETITGLYNLFIPAYDGFDLTDKATGKKFIDKFGNSNIEETKKHFTAERDNLLKKGDLEGYSEFVRMFPMRFSECFRIATGACKFNPEIINKRIEEFRFGNPNVVKGNFQWKNGIKDTEVEWIPSESGKFIMSHIPDIAFQNKFVLSEGLKSPAFAHLYIAGGDPFKFNVTKGKKSEISDGSGAVFRKFDPSVDDINGDKSKWKSNKFCMTYSNRPRTKDEYGEDMVMMCFFYGCQMYPEINVDFLWEYFERRGYVKYLYFQIDLKTRKKSKTPGAHTNQNIQESIFGEFSYYIENFGKYEYHTEILEQCLEIQDDMNPFDLFVGAGYALIGAKRQVAPPSEVVNAPMYHRKYKYYPN